MVKIDENECSEEVAPIDTQESFMSLDGDGQDTVNGTSDENEGNYEIIEEETVKLAPKKRKRCSEKPKADASKTKKPSMSRKSRATKMQSKEQDSSKLNPSVSTTKHGVSNNSGPWKPEDDQLLIDLVLSHLKEIPWTKLAKSHFPSRSRQALVGRWNSLKKKMLNVNSDGDAVDDREGN
ncbi:13829_t:CDS:2 [Acaulospora morrowiae]|uniref:13829_t:CDS:1 n=1 Tax=Acaulospora morrowiae TaxID=94023 RepID=A0A9N9A6T3_9GLOM|nr:13829_t:CDS:2 [Acaulospora morrowiae]